VKPGRNARCPCGTGKKYKNCCARQGVESGIGAAIPTSTATVPSNGFAEGQARSAAMRELTFIANLRDYGQMETKARRLVDVSPRFGFAWKALSVALEMQGKEALPELQSAVQFLPQDVEVHSNLGSALRRAGRVDEAIASYRRALEISPGIAEVWNNLGNAQLDQGRFDDAVESFRRALGLKSNFAKPYNNLGNALRYLGRLDEAVAAYRRAVELDPDLAEAHNNLAIVLRMQNRPAEAESCCRRALKVDPELVAAIMLLAELHSDRGQFTAAEELFKRASALEPDSPEAWAGVAGLRRMTGADSDWLAGAQRIAGKRLAPRREVPLRYALGKYFDDVTDYAQAFVNYRRANELAKVNLPAHDRRILEQSIDRMIQSYDRVWLSGARVNPLGNERPVFIVGMPRSGTTLAEQILASHDAVFGAGELPFWNTAASIYAASRSTGNDDDPSVLRGLADDYLSMLSDVSDGARRVVDKMPANFLYLGLIHAALPDARIIHMRRNPIDTCLSIYFQNFDALHPYANDLADLAHYHGEYLRLMEHWRLTLPPGTILEVPYEGLVEDPEGWSRRMLEFIALPWDPKCLDFHRTTRTVSTFSKWQARQKIVKSSVERWRHYQEFIGPLLPLVKSDEPSARTDEPFAGTDEISSSTDEAPPPGSCTPETSRPVSLELAKSLHAAGLFADAGRMYRELLSRDPSDFEANHNLGIVALQTGEAELAIEPLSRAIALNSRHVRAYANLGTAYLLTNRLEEALRACDEALGIDSGLAGGWRNRGTILHRLGRYEEAADSFQRCSEIAPGFDFALGSMFESRRYACDWSDFQGSSAAILAGVAAGQNVDRPFSFLSVSGSAEAQYRCAKLHAAYLSPRMEPARWRGERYGHQKIRVAYVSADYSAHVVMKLLAPILESHDRQRFHTIGISLAPEDDSEILRRAKQALSQFIGASRLSDADIAKAIRELEVDVVVDLTGYTGGCRAGIFARRAAPVQVGYLGYIGTSGATYFDYLIADRVAIPKDHERFFSERIVRLPHSFLPPDESEPITVRTPTRRDLGLPDDGFVFCAFSNCYKLNPEMFDVWMRLLRHVPRSVLWLRDGASGTRANLRREAGARGVEPDRLTFAAKVPAMDEHLARHRQADLFLDTLPYGAHATARDALWAGLPVLTCLGESFAARVGASLLTALNLPELVTGSLSDYETRAIELAHDRGRLEVLRSRLAGNLRTQPHFDTPRYCKLLESAYTEMWRRAERGDRPISFDVAASPP
jgi:protein O-GlcNAc transferase